MAISAVLGWESEVAAGANKDAAALRRLTKVLTQASAAHAAFGTGAATQALGQLGNAAAIAAVQVEQVRGANQRESAAAASAAQQNAALAKLILLQAKAKADASKQSVKAQQDETKAAEKEAAQRTRIAEKAAKDAERITKNRLKEETKAKKKAADEQEKIDRARDAEHNRRSAAGGRAANGILGGLGLTSPAGAITSDLIQALGGTAAMAGPIGAAIGATVAVITKIGTAIYEAYEKAAAVVTSLAVAGTNLVFDATSSKDAIVDTFVGIGKTNEQSEKLYDKIVSMSIRTGRDKNTLAAEFKRLSAVGFGDDQLPLIAKMLEDVSLVKGEGKANQLEKLFTKIQAKGSLDPRVVTALTNQGFSQKELYATIAKSIHRSEADIPSLIKAGKINAQVAEDAIAKLVEHQVGGVANERANEVLVLFARIKTAIDALFVVTDAQIAPVKKFLNNIIAMLSPDGKEGQALKSAIGDLFGAIFGTAFDDLNSSGGQKTLSDTFMEMAKAIHLAADEARALRPVVQNLIAMVAEMSKNGTLQALVTAGGVAAKEKLQEQGDKAKATSAQAKAVSDAKSGDHTPGAGMAAGAGALPMLAAAPFLAIPALVGLGIVKALDMTETGQGITRHAKSLFSGDDADGKPANDVGGTASALGSNMTGALADQDMPGQGVGIGLDLSQGLADGVAAGEDGAINAVVNMANAMILAANTALDRHSPSRVFHAVGVDIPRGAAGGVDAGTQHATRAVGRMSDSMTDEFGAGPAFGSSAASSASRGASGGGHTFVIQVASGASARSGGDEALGLLIQAKIESTLRQYMNAS